MSHDPGAVFEAIRRWERVGLVSREQAAALQAEVASAAQVGTRRLSQYVIAVTGAVVLLLAGGLFLDWSWPLLGDGGRTALLGAVALALLIFGRRLEEGHRWLPVAYLLQAAALCLLLSSFIYSKRAWDDLSLGGFTVGALSLAAPIVLAPLAMRRGVVMPAVHLALGLGFLTVFLDRATHLDQDGILWVVDVVLAIAVFGLVRLLRGDPFGERHPWVLNAFATAMTAGFVLIALTAIGPLRLDDASVLPLDVWLALNIGLVAWGIGRSEPVRRAWLARILAQLLFLGIPFGFFTALETLNGPPELAVLLVGGGGVVAFLYANRGGHREAMGVAALAFISALWYWAVDRGGALGGVLALGATAALLFWISGRSGRSDASEST